MPPRLLSSRPSRSKLRSFGPLSSSLLLLCVLGCRETPAEGSPGPSATTATLAAAKPEAPASSARREPSRVRLDGSAEPLAVNAVSSGPRVYSRQLRTWVYEKPSSESRKLGYLRAGASSPTTEKPAGFDGCKQGWYPVQPRGFVCLDAAATLDKNDPVVRAAESYPPHFENKLPYMYGTVRKPGPVYQWLPSGEELRQSESGFEKRMETWLSAEGEIGASYAQNVWTWGATAPDPREVFVAKKSDGVPQFLAGAQPAPRLDKVPRPSGAVLEQMRSKVGYSFLDTFLHEGRRYGLTTQFEVVPTDRLRPIQGSDFHGVEVGKDVDFPFAFVRHEGAKFVTANGKTGESAPYRAVLKLTGKQRFFGGVLHFETEDGTYLSDRLASRLDLAKRMPAWAQKGEKWIDVNITKQTLVLYEGTKPVYATLISSGEAGLASSDDTTATRRGIFRIHTKHITATMASDETGEEFELRDVPYVQYFEDGYALHGAYWHDRFGVPKSHGCINLSPEDARRVFSWTEPQVPTGWHGALLPLEGTVMFVHQ